MCDHCGCDEAPAGAGSRAHRTISIQEDVLAHDREHARRLRERLAREGTDLINVIGSPGAGKTALLCALVQEIGTDRQCAVVEGDLATDLDARRMRDAGVPAYQIETGTACHLTAPAIEHALGHLPVEPGGLIFIENVGNLVCPSMFDLGESLRMVCLSVAEGQDKPVKYPVAFRETGLVVITKSDLLPHVDFDLAACLKSIDDLVPGLPCLVTSARSGDGVSELAQRLMRARKDS